ncbi:MAG: response regulator transcription factor [Haliscomenobacter sp.]|nr:response regulator transcription factor [Haliscomenobacter sp.]
MNILIIEDELPASKRLSSLLVQFRPQAQILAALDSVKAAVQWLQQHPAPDLIFLDIHLGDGLCFEIFRQIQVRSPAIFTTAYDQYTLQAFKLNSIDYLLKPIDPEELQAALLKYDQLHGHTISYDPQIIQQFIQGMQQPEYKARFLVKMGNTLGFVPVQDMRYFYSEDGLVFGRIAEGKKYALDYTLESLETLLNPREFFRINRKVILQANSVSRIHPYFNNRLKLDLLPAPDFEVVVSRERASAFKEWMDL